MARWLVYILILLAWFPFPLLEEQGLKEASGIRLVLLLFAFALLLLMGRIRFPKIFLPYALFLSYAAVTVLWSPAKAEGVRTVAKWLYPLLFGLLVYQTIHSTREITRLLRLFAWSGVIGLLFSVPLLFLRQDADNYWITSVYGWSGVGMYGYFTGLLALLFISLFATRRKARYRSWGIFLAVQSVATLVRTTFGALMLALLALDFRIGKWWRAPLLMLLGGIVFVYSPLFDRMFYTPIEPVDLLTTPIADTLRNVRLSGRANFWGVALDHIDRTNIVQGSGLGTYITLAVEASGLRWQAHGEWLKLVLETGLIGTAIMLSFFVTAWLRLSKLVGRTSDPLTRGLCLGGMSGLLFYAIIAVAGNPFGYYAEFTGPLFAILVMAIRSYQMQGRLHPARRANHPRALGLPTHGRSAPVQHSLPEQRAGV